ncbi:MAG: HD domain-containing protein [Campylobacterota bacterium]|nr:HD domain-containing protein [Campylobacterota bacterium]
MKIDEYIEDLIEKNASDFEISKLFKSHIKEYTESLGVVFEKNQGKDFLVKHTKALDSIIILMYKTILRRTFGNYLPMRNSIPIVIIALGSYGREQLCVHSDIDLMIAYEEVDGYDTNLIIEKLLYLAWDAGLKLGHRVHVVSDISKAAQEDITIRTSLMESRLIIGSQFTWGATQRELNKVRSIDPKAYILAKIEEARTRRKRYPISMQPNIKESVGALRDSQLLFWIATTIHGFINTKDLTGQLFSEEEYREYRISLELLFRVRSALHLIAGKQQDQLLLEHLPQISKMLGFKNPQKLATKVLQTLWRINNFTQIFITKMLRSYLSRQGRIKELKASRIEKGYYLIDNTLYATFHSNNKTVNQLLELLVSLDDKAYQFDPSFLVQFTYVTIKRPLRVKTYTLLRKLFEKKHTYSFLKLFYNAGILQELLSAFKKVLHLPQFDGYHHYPVDIHSIDSVKSLENIKEPLIAKLYNELSHEEQTVLKITTLIHDTGKGRKQDHGEVGAKLIVPLLKKFKFSELHQESAALLIKHHILMSSVAYNEDLHSEKTLYKFMSKIKTASNLQLLYILTYADINGVGPGVYNTFSSKLLKKLYYAALEISQQSDRISDATKRLQSEKRIKNSAIYKELPKLLQKKILKIESNLFFFKHSPDEIMSIATTAREIKDYTYRINSSHGFSIEILRLVPLNLSYLLGQLSHLDVASMDVFTLFDEIKYFKIEFLNQPDSDTIEHIKQIIDDSFDMSKKTTIKKPIIHADEITLDCNHSLTYAQLNVKTANQRGLLAYIVKCFDDENINIATAKIHTTKHKAKDHFLIEKTTTMCDNTAQIITMLTQEHK